MWALPYVNAMKGPERAQECRPRELACRTMPADFGWFYRLSMDEKVTLLRDPYGTLPAGLIEHLLERPGVVGIYWATQDGPTRWILTPEAAKELSAAGHQLEWWWDRLDDDAQAHLIAHRRDEIDGRYASLVSDASGTAPDPALVVVMVSDNRTGRFRLPQMVDVFVEMQAGNGEPPSVG
jgi:hypothetical protein